MEKIIKTIVLDRMGDFIKSELVITDRGRTIISYNPPYPKNKEGEKK